jgi:hypothetical protein
VLETLLIVWNLTCRAQFARLLRSLWVLCFIAVLDSFLCSLCSFCCRRYAVGVSSGSYVLGKVLSDLPFIIIYSFVYTVSFFTVSPCFIMNHFGRQLCRPFCRAV